MRNWEDFKALEAEIAQFELAAYVLITTEHGMAFTVAEQAAKVSWPGQSNLQDEDAANVSWPEQSDLRDEGAIVRWAGVSTGLYDVIVIVRAKDMESLTRLVVQRLQTIEGVKADTTTTNVIGSVYLSPNAQFGHP